jgi:hypothetical protein
VSASGNDLVKTGSVGWNAGAVTNETLAGDGYVEFTTGALGTAKAAGLSSGNGGQSPNDIDYAFYLTASGGLHVWEAGIDRGAFGVYVAGDVFRVQVLGGTVTYYRNGALLYTSAVLPTLPLLVDTSLNGVGATINDVVLGTAPAIGWQGVSGVATTIDSLVKTRGTGWNAGASTHAGFSGDGYCSFTVDAGTKKMAGLSNGDSGVGYTDIDFAIYPSSDQKVLVYESGTYRGTFGTYVAGDQFRVESVAGFIQYYKNGSMFYASTVAPSAPLVVDTSLYTTGATIQNVTISPASFYWKSRVNITASGTSLTKSGSTAAWDAGASTAASLGGNVYAQFTTAESNTAKMVGLSRVDASRKFQDIEFALYLTAGGKVQVYESGVLRGTFGSYAAGNVFRVSAVGGVVTYSKNGAVFYTSSAPATSPLLLDTSLLTPGATVNDAVLASL